MEALRVPLKIIKSLDILHNANTYDVVFNVRM